MFNDINLHIGRRLRRRRRRLLGLTMQQLAGACGVRFQQIQKYECGANRISAPRLWRFCGALEVPVGYFYDGLSAVGLMDLDAEPVLATLGSKETLDLLRAYYRLSEQPRRRLLALAVSMNGDDGSA